MLAPEGNLDITASGVLNLNSKLDMNSNQVANVISLALDESVDHTGSLSAGNTLLYVNASKELLFKTTEEAAIHPGSRILTEIEQDLSPRLAGDLNTNGYDIHSTNSQGFAIALNTVVNSPANSTLTLRSLNTGSGKGIIDLNCDRITGSVISTDATFASSIDTDLASQLAIKTYVDLLVASSLISTRINFRPSATDRYYFRDGDNLSMSDSYWAEYDISPAALTAEKH
jgi:hypothetical protein